MDSIASGLAIYLKPPQVGLNHGSNCLKLNIIGFDATNNQNHFIAFISSFGAMQPKSIRYCLAIFSAQYPIEEA